VVRLISEPFVKREAISTSNQHQNIEIVVKNEAKNILFDKASGGGLSINVRSVGLKTFK